MQFLKKYAAQNGFSYKDLINDFYSSSPEEQNAFLMQVGGESQVESPEDQMMQIVQMFAQLTGSDPEQLIQQMSQLPPEEHEKMMQGMIQTIQQSQGQQSQGPQLRQEQQMQSGGGFLPRGHTSLLGEENQLYNSIYDKRTPLTQEELLYMAKNEERASGYNPNYRLVFNPMLNKEMIPDRRGGFIVGKQNKNTPDDAYSRYNRFTDPKSKAFSALPQLEDRIKQSGGVPITSEGYRELDPAEDPYAMIPSGRISMQGIPGNINAYDGRTGNFLEQMQPGGEYQFDTDMVLEEPLYAQTGPTPVVTKIEKNFIHLSNGKKITQNQFKTDYLDRMAFLNTKRYDTEERRNAASIVSSYNAVNKETTLAANKAKKPVNPLTGELDPAKGYWDRTLNYTENRKDPRATAAEAKIMPFSGVESEGFLDYAGTVASHLQKKGNQILTGYYEYPSTTVERYHGEMGMGEKFTLDLVTDPMFVYDFGPMAVKAAGKQVAKYAPELAKVAKETAELVGKYGSVAAVYIARHGKIAAKYIAEHGLDNIEKALLYVEKNYPKIDQYASIKTQILKQVNNDNNEDPYISYITSIAEKTEEDSSIADVLNNTQKKLDTVVKASSSKNPANLTKAFETINPIAAEKSKEIGSPGINYSEIFSKSTGSVPQKGIAPNYLASSPKFSMGDYGKNAKINTVKENTSTSSQGSSSKPQGAPEKFKNAALGKTSSKYLPSSTDKSEWTGQWEKFLVGKGIIQADGQQYSVGEIDDLVANYVKANPDKYKNNAYFKDPKFDSLLRDNIYGKLHESIRPPQENVNFQPKPYTDVEIDEMAAANMPGAVAPPNRTLDTVGGDKYWKNSPAGMAASEASIKSKNPQYKFASNNMIQNMLVGNNLASAFQSPAQVFRQRANVQAEELPEIDLNPAFQQLRDQFKAAQRNINMNSAVGASVAANFYGETLDKMVQLQNTGTAQNQQIKAKNLFSKINAANTQYQQQQQYDAAAYDDFLRTSANADMIKQQALSEAGSVYLQQKKDRQMLDMLPMLNPEIAETSTTFGKMFGQRTYEQNPEYVKLVLQTNADAKAKADLEAKAIADAKKAAATVKTP